MIQSYLSFKNAHVEEHSVKTGCLFIRGRQIGLGPVVADWFDRIIFICFLSFFLSFLSHHHSRLC